MDSVIIIIYNNNCILLKSFIIIIAPPVVPRSWCSFAGLIGAVVLFSMEGGAHWGSGVI